MSEATPIFPPCNEFNIGDRRLRRLALRAGNFIIDACQSMPSPYMYLPPPEKPTLAPVIRLKTDWGFDGWIEEPAPEKVE